MYTFLIYNGFPLGTGYLSELTADLVQEGTADTLLVHAVGLFPALIAELLHPCRLRGDVFGRRHRDWETMTFPGF